MFAFYDCANIARYADNILPTDAKSLLMNVYVSRNEETFGPYSVEDVRKMLRDNALLPMDLACIEGGDEWRPLYQVIDPRLKSAKVVEVAVPTLSPIRSNDDAHANSDDIVLFVGKRAEKYAGAWEEGGGFWNTAAFLFPTFWLIYRRMYLYAFALIITLSGIEALVYYLIPQRFLVANSIFSLALLIAPMYLAGKYGSQLYLKRAATLILGIKLVRACHAL